MVINILTKLRRGMNEHSDILNKKTENIRKYQTAVITQLKNTLEGFNSRLDEEE